MDKYNDGQSEKRIKLEVAEEEVDEFVEEQEKLSGFTNYENLNFNVVVQLERIDDSGLLTHEKTSKRKSYNRSKTCEEQLGHVERPLIRCKKCRHSVVHGLNEIKTHCLNHWKRANNVKKVLTCSTCLKTYINKRRLHCHLRIIHNQSKITAGQHYSEDKAKWKISLAEIYKQCFSIDLKKHEQLQSPVVKRNVAKKRTFPAATIAPESNYNHDEWPSADGTMSSYIPVNVRRAKRGYRRSAPVNSTRNTSASCYQCLLCSDDYYTAVFEQLIEHFNLKHPNVHEYYHGVHYVSYLQKDLPQSASVEQQIGEPEASIYSQPSRACTCRRGMGRKNHHKHFKPHPLSSTFSQSQQSWLPEDHGYDDFSNGSVYSQTNANGSDPTVPECAGSCNYCHPPVLPEMIWRKYDDRNSDCPPELIPAVQQSMPKRCAESGNSNKNQSSVCVKLEPDDEDKPGAYLTKDPELRSSEPPSISKVNQTKIFNLASSKPAKKAVPVIFKIVPPTVKTKGSIKQESGIDEVAESSKLSSDQSTITQYDSSATVSSTTFPDPPAQSATASVTVLKKMRLSLKPQSSVHLPADKDKMANLVHGRLGSILMRMVMQGGGPGNSARTDKEVKTNVSSTIPKSSCAVPKVGVATEKLPKIPLVQVALQEKIMEPVEYETSDHQSLFRDVSFIVCNKCWLEVRDTTNTRRSHCLQHMNVAQTSIGVYLCKICQQNDLNWDELRDHLQNRHQRTPFAHKNYEMKLLPYYRDEIAKMDDECFADAVASVRPVIAKNKSSRRVTYINCAKCSTQIVSLAANRLSHVLQHVQGETEFKWIYKCLICPDFDTMEQADWQNHVYDAHRDGPELVRDVHYVDNRAETAIPIQEMEESCFKNQSLYT